MSARSCCSPRWCSTLAAGRHPPTLRHHSAPTLASTELALAGAPTRILAAMKRHSGDPGVQTWSCFAVGGVLVNAVDSGSSSRHPKGPASPSAITDAFGTASTQLILDAMLKHIDDVHFCWAALSATKELGYFNADIAEAFMIYGAPARVVAVMRRHPHLLSLASEAAQTLCSWGPNEYKAAFMRVGGGDLFVAVFPYLQAALAGHASEETATSRAAPAGAVVVRGLALEQAVAIARAVATRAHAAAATAAAAVGRWHTRAAAPRRAGGRPSTSGKV